MGRHYPNLEADPVQQPGYYFSGKFNKLARLQLGEKLPRHMGPWEFVARDGEATSSQVLQRLKEAHPDLDAYRLTFTTTTPVDMQHMTAQRARRFLGYAVFALAAVGLGLLFGRIQMRRA